MLFKNWFTYSFWYCLTIVAAFTVELSFVSAQDIVPNQYIIKYKNQLSVTDASVISASIGVASSESLNQKDLFLIKEDKKNKINFEAINQLISSNVIEYIEPDAIGHITAIPNDPMYSNQWALNNNGSSGGVLDVDIDAPEAWDITTGSSNVIVAIVDTGVLYTHPDLVSSMWVNPTEVPNNGIDDDLNGVIDDIYGYNAISDSGTPLDDRGHGSHCAGIIAATGNNSIGVIGVAHKVKIMALKAFGSDGTGKLSDVIKAINYVIGQKQKGVNVRLLSNSWGGFPNSPTLKSLINDVGNNGMLFVAGAGNDSANNDTTPFYPASFDVSNIISVAAIDRAGNLASFSNYGSNSVDIAAPGVSILSTVLGNTYQYYNGTSMATPHVSAVAALLFSHEPNLSGATVKARIIASAKPLSSLGTRVLSGGMVSAFRALGSTVFPVPTKAVFSDFDGDGKSDLIVWRPTTAVWYLKSSSAFNKESYESHQWGLPADVPLIGDYDGDKKADLVVWRPSNGTWYVKTSSTGYESGIVIQWGLNGDTPLVGDHDGDGISDITVYRQSSGSFYTLLSKSGFNRDSAISGSPLAYRQVALGGLANDPVLGDYNGDGIDDYVTLWQLIRFWQIKLADGTFLSSLPWGIPGDNPRACDFNSDGTDDRIVVRVNSGFTLDWYGALAGQGYKVFTFGSLGDNPGCRHDYNGDGIDESLVFRPNSGNWYLRDGNTGDLTVHQFGLPGDIAMVN